MIHYYNSKLAAFGEAVITRYQSRGEEVVKVNYTKTIILIVKPIGQKIFF
jgi:hypothetical protein